MKNLLSILLVSVLFILACANGSASNQQNTEDTEEATIHEPEVEAAPNTIPNTNVIPANIAPFSKSVVQVATGIPAFIGYTEKTNTNGPSVKNLPVKVKSLQEFESIFGNGNKNNPKTLLGYYYLYESIVQFYAHGGQDCYILSVGDYSDPIAAQDLTGVMAVGGSLERKTEPAMIVIPDALALDANATANVYRSVLRYCERMKTCIGIFDVHRGFDRTSMDSDIEDFRNNIGNEFLKYGATYYPWVKVNNKSMPTAGIMAGVMASTDRTRGVWKAPANVSLNAGVTPAFEITSKIQEGLNVDPTSGKSINAIRAFAGKGTVVWGARSLAGNSADWRYINVVRSTIMVDHSIRNYLAQYRSKPNDKTTWSAVEAGVDEFLSGLWREGALAGSKAEEAYGARIGLGSTMTARDVANGKLILNVMMAMVRPAEFMVLVFEEELTR